MSREFGLGLNLEDMKKCKSHFSKRDEDPTDVEVQTIAQAWSEHCYHRTFKGDIQFNGENIRLIRDYIKKATDEISPEWCVSVFEDNAGIVKFDDERSIAAKVETHNHPSAIEPFGGAATGVGGVIRDILGVWAWPMANTDVLCFGPPDYEIKDLPKGTKHPKYLMRGVIEGIGHYGNNMGIPTVNGAICFDEGYVGNIVVYCGCIGTMPTESYVREQGPGDVIVIAGGRTGKDGIHGVTFASDELDEKSEESSRPAVQIPNPIEEEKLRRAILEIRERELGTSITDLGGGGLSSAIGEKAEEAGCGAKVELDKIPKKHGNIAPWEIWISESQERMFITVKEENLEEVMEIFEDEEVEATAVGSLTDVPRLKLNYQGRKVADLDLNFLFNPPRILRTATWNKPDLEKSNIGEPEDLERVLLNLLSEPNVASKESVIRTYDHEVQGNTALKPLQGMESGPNDAAILKPFKDSNKGVVVSSGIRPSYGKIDPYWMAASSVEEALRNNLAVGGRRISLLDNFTWGNPEDEEVLGGLVRACEACYDFATAFETPFISGKDSLYNESPKGPVTPTLLITGVGLIPDINNAVSMEFKKAGNPVYLIGRTYEELGGSKYLKLREEQGKRVPKVRPDEFTKKASALRRAMDEGCVRACHDLSDGGLGVAGSEMTFSEGLGLDLNLRDVPSSLKRNDHLLFSESNGRFMVEVSEEKTEKFEKILEGCEFGRVGRVTGDGIFRVRGTGESTALNVNTDKLENRWKEGFNID
ncbi:MAG: phosphoribosylformylglycinamidine synthase subunit PurL [Candidatus Hadarchaeota archaeon]